MLQCWQAGAVAVEDILDALTHIESFVVRRDICNVPTNQLKKIFLAMTRELPRERVAPWLAARLAGGAAGGRWPKDDEVLERISQYRAYARRTERCRFILERIELGHGHKEQASFEGATIEHVMPQTLSVQWREELGEDVEALYSRWIDTLPNLTLSGYNIEMSNSPFSEKRKRLSESNFAMNRWIAQQQRWTEAEMRARTQIIFDKIKCIWPRPATDG